MLRIFGSILIAGLVFGAGSAGAAPLPAAAKKATVAELKTLIDGKTVEVEIYDMEKPVTATLVWNWTKHTITGTAVVGGKQKVKVKTTLSQQGEKVCSTADGNTSCHDVYIDGNTFYEVRDDGEVHSKSSIKG